MNFEKILLLFRTNYDTKPNNLSQLLLNQVKVKVTILPTHCYHHQYDTQDMHLYIELRKQTSKVWNYLLKT